MNYITLWFINPIKNQYADFNGRATREQYWMFVLVNIILSILLSIIASALHVKVLSTLFTLAVLIPSIAFATRRLHDINKSGWWQLIGLIPLLGLIILIVFLAQKGDAGTNPYGNAALASSIPNPTPEVKEESNESTEAK